MKTFKDLEFKNISGLNRAFLEFNNGYGISVINGHGAYCDDETYEAAVLFHGKITYNTPITDDVLTYQTPKDITNAMKQIQEL